jgi:hypothetical protein
MQVERAFSIGSADDFVFNVRNERLRIQQFRERHTDSSNFDDRAGQASTGAAAGRSAETCAAASRSAETCTAASRSPRHFIHEWRRVPSFDDALDGRSFQFIEEGFCSLLPPISGLDRQCRAGG